MKNTFKKIACLILLVILSFTLSSCSKVEFSFNRDGSGVATFTISKTYTNDDGDVLTYTREELDTTIDNIIYGVEICSGMEDRVKLKSIKETDDYYIVKLKFMRIQYLSKSGIGGDLGIYQYKDSSDFVDELDSVSVLEDYWTLGSYKSLIKLETNTKYAFKNAMLGDDDAAFKPTYRETGKEMTDKEIESFFSEDGILKTTKNGTIFTFFLVDIEGLESVTFTFKGNIVVYGTKSVESVTKNSITVKPIKQKATLTRVDTETVTKDVNCFVGYVFFELSPNYVAIGIFALLGIALISLIVVLLVKGKIQKAIHSKKMKTIVNNYELYLMLLPAMVFIFIFAYVPMAGIVLAFKNYKLTDGIWGSEWASMCGLKNFIDLFTSPSSDFGELMANTFILAFWRFIFGFLVAIILAVLFSYLKEGLFKKSVQTISYFPYFISWVVISTISYAILATDGGTINNIIHLFNKDAEAINFYASPKYWRFILTFTYLWKTAGYSTIIYLAAISGIDQSLYEAAKMDGANRFSQLWHVTLPGLFPVIGIQIVFSLGNLVKDDFDQIYTMIRGSALLRDTTDTIGMIVYENISNASAYSGVAAMGILQGLIALILVVVSNHMLKKRGIQGAY